MQRENDRHAARELPEHVQRGTEAGRIVDERRAVQRHQDVATPLQAEGRARACAQRAGQEREQRVDHRVADDRDASRVDALRRQVLGAIVARTQQEVGEPIGENAVDLLGHRPVTRSKPRLEVHHRDPELGGREGGGEGRVDVAGDQDGVGGMLGEVPFDAEHHRGGLLGVGPGTDAEVHVRLGKPELLEEASERAAS